MERSFELSKTDFSGFAVKLNETFNSSELLGGGLETRMWAGGSHSGDAELYLGVALFSTFHVCQKPIPMDQRSAALILPFLVESHLKRIDS